MSWMRRYIGRSTARAVGLPVPGYWNRKWDRKILAELDALLTTTVKSGEAG